jgi:hypothetical protein
VTFNQLLTLAKEFNRLFSHNGRDVVKLVKPIITKHATDSSGNFCTRAWRLCRPGVGQGKLLKWDTINNAYLSAVAELQGVQISLGVKTNWKMLSSTQRAPLVNP